MIHGTEDAAFTPAHAHAFADEIPGAQLVMIDRLGHVSAPSSFPTILPAVLSHIGA
jgi:pimeloyl-ACP methyl ester carboxylesterase